MSNPTTATPTAMDTGIISTAPATPLHNLTHAENPLSRSSSTSSFDDARLPANPHHHRPPLPPAAASVFRRRKPTNLQRLSSTAELDIPSPPATDSETDSGSPTTSTSTASATSSTLATSAASTTAIKDTIPVTLKSTSGTSSYRLRLTPDLQSLLVSKTRRRPRFGDFVFTERFTAFDRLNPSASSSPYHGFFVLAWLAAGLWCVKTMAEHYRGTGKLMETDILSMMFDPRCAIECLLVDVALFYGSTLWCVPLQKAVAKGKIKWGREGWALQALAELAVVGAVLVCCGWREWYWIQNVYLFLHSLVIVMKMHSYAAYNGYLSGILKRKGKLEERLRGIMESDSDDEDESEGQEKKELTDLIASDLDTCTRELTRTVTTTTASSSGMTTTTSTTITYPDNLTFGNYLLYLHFPTVVYELAYPRSSHRSWYAILEKLLAVAGTLFTMILISQTHIYPTVTQHLNSPPASPLSEYPWLLLRLIFPLTSLYILVFYLIWETILNLLAELTRFSDRGFYNNWWNSASWDAFARDWNVPVHAFLLRHVYHSAISTWQIKRTTATLVTFAISSVVHELVMAVIFRKLRGYLLVAQMGQLPLVWMSRQKWIKEWKVLGNVMFWVGIAMGPGFLCAGYVLL